MSEGKRSKKPVLVLLVILSIMGAVAIAVNANSNYVPMDFSSSGDSTSANSSDSSAGTSVPRTYRPVSYDSLSRDPDAMKGKFIKVKGEITQVIEDDTTYQGLIAITYNSGYAYYSDNILFVIPKSIMNVRLLKEDIVTLYGQSQGLMTYTSVLGSDITSPCIYVNDMEFHNGN